MRSVERTTRPPKAPALATITTADLRPALAELEAPVGAIWGDADRTVPIRALADLTESRPDALVARITDTGHVPMVERPGAFVAALERLLDELPERRDTLIQDITTLSEVRSIVL